jgi:PKD repeat protein
VTRLIVIGILDQDMKKKPSARISLITIGMLVLASFTSNAIGQPTEIILSLCSLGTNDTTAGTPAGILLQNTSVNRITWTVAQNNRNGSNGFTHFDYPNKAVVKNANSFAGITPSNTVFAYVVASQSNTLTILNATKSWSQTEFSSYLITDPHDVYIMDYPSWGRVAFVCSFSQGALWAVNVTNPRNMTTLDVRFDSSNNGMYMDVDEVHHILYLTDWNASRDDYLLAYNITNPSNMTLICKAVVPRGKPWSPRVNTNNRDYVYVACEGEGAYVDNGSVCVFNVTWVRNTTSPSMRYMKAQGCGSFADLRLDGIYLYGDTSLNWSLCVWDVSTPTNLTTVSVTNLQTFNHFCLVSSPLRHEYAFLRHYDATVGDHGVAIVDINDKNNPVTIGYIPDDGGAHVRDLWRCHWMQCAYNNITNTWVLYVIGYMDNSWVTFNITFNATSQPPVADFSYTMRGLSVTFDGSSSYDSDGLIMSWQWTFGDSTDGVGEIVTHTFPSVGIYTISVVVTDIDGATSTHTANIRVEDFIYQRAFIFGWITNLSPEKGLITFEAVRVGVVTVAPFSFFAYSSGELFTIMKQYHGILRPGFIFAFCKKQITNINLTGLFL